MPIGADAQLSGGGLEAAAAEHVVDRVLRERGLAVAGRAEIHVIDAPAAVDGHPHQTRVLEHLESLDDDFAHVEQGLVVDAERALRGVESAGDRAGLGETAVGGSARAESLDHHLGRQLLQRQGTDAVKLRA